VQVKIEDGNFLDTFTKTVIFVVCIAKFSIQKNSTERGARAVERGSLENCYRSNSIEGSNPSLSAQKE
jgi:hypothetical protein